MALTEFDPTEARARDGTPRLTIQANGQGYLNKAATVQYYHKANAVRRYTDVEYCQLGLESVSEQHLDEPSVVRVSSKTDAGANIALGPTVLSAFGLDDLEESVQVELVRDSDAGMPVADLSALVDEHTDDEICDCGKRCKGENGLRNHYAQTHAEDAVTASDLADEDVTPSDVGLSELGERASGGGEGD